MDDTNPKRGPARNIRNTRNKPKRWQLRLRVQNEVNAANEEFLNGNMAKTSFDTLQKDAKAKLEAWEAAQEDLENFLADAAKKVQIAAISAE